MNDLGNQFIPYHAHLWDLLHGTADGGLLLNWQSGYGSSFLPDLGTYVSSPFALLVGLFPRDEIDLAVYVVSVLKIRRPPPRWPSCCWRCGRALVGGGRARRLVRAVRVDGDARVVQPDVARRADRLPAAVPGGGVGQGRAAARGVRRGGRAVLDRQLLHRVHGDVGAGLVLIVRLLTEPDEEGAAAAAAGPRGARRWFGVLGRRRSAPGLGIGLTRLADDDHEGHRARLPGAGEGVPAVAVG